MTFWPIFMYYIYTRVSVQFDDFFISLLV